MLNCTVKTVEINKLYFDFRIYLHNISFVVKGNFHRESELWYDKSVIFRCFSL